MTSPGGVGRSHRVGRRSVRLLVVLACLTPMLAAGCSNDDTLPTVTLRPTTTDPNANADLEPTIPPLPAADIVQALDDAARSQDFCAVLTAFDSAQPDVEDPAGVTSVYRAMSAAAIAATAFVPVEVRADWDVVVAGTGAAAEAVDDHDGDLTDPEVDVALTSNEMVDAIRNVERYQLRECPVAAAGG